MINLMNLVLITLASITVACGGSSFNGNGDKKIGVDDSIRAGANGAEGEGGKDSENDADQTGPTLIEKGGEDGDELSEDDKAVNTCLTKFGRHPFDKDQVQNYKKISAAISVLGSGTPVNDTEITSEPALILIVAGVNVLGSPTYVLGNPNGFYCIKVGVNVQADFTIKKHCQAKLESSSKVQVNVLSESQPTAGVGVDVLSKVRVEETGC